MRAKVSSQAGYLARIGEIFNRPALFWLLIALAVRLLAGTVLHLYSEAQGFAGFYPLASGSDDRIYWSQAQSLLVGTIPPGIVCPYPYVLSGLFAIFGPSLILGKLLSIVAGSLAVYVGVLAASALAAHRPYSWRDLRHPANLAGLLLTLYPSAVFHSTVLLRDSLILFFGLLGIYYGLRILEDKGNTLVWPGYFLALTLLYDFRPYAGFVLSLSFVLYQLFLRQRAIALLAGLFVAMAAPWLAGFGPFAWQYVNNFINPQTVATFREDVYNIGGSAIGVTVDFSSISGFLLTYPYSFLTAMFGPFLWQVRSQVIAIGLLEALPVLFLLPEWVKGIWRVLRRQEGREGFLLLFSLALIGAIALFSGNIGANLRLRLLPWSAFLIFAAVQFGGRLQKSSGQSGRK
ncbi:MAG: hypothetical protein KGZ56_09920 [Dethiobacter sp.]|nr:hypothetical protein [Dethiobacter sp.]MBS3898338.1 hypothetical protein [Dethiobacter sp.]